MKPMLLFFYTSVRQYEQKWSARKIKINAQQKYKIKDSNKTFNKNIRIKKVTVLLKDSLKK